MKEAIIAGIVSTLISTVVVGIGVWYLNDLRSAVELKSEISYLKSDQTKLTNDVNQLTEKINKLGESYARLDERLSSYVRYNEKALSEISKSKQVPPLKVESARQYLSTTPEPSKATKYLETNLGFTPDEAKAVISFPKCNEAIPNRW